MSRLRAWVGSTLLLVTSSAAARAQTISGTVLDSTYSKRVPAAQVMLRQKDTAYTALTNDRGQFRFRARAGPFKLTISALGYSLLDSELFNVGKDENVSVVVLLSVAPVEIAPIHVIARSRRALYGLDDFRDRMRKKTGFAYFMDERILERYSANLVTDILRHVPGAWVAKDQVQLRPYCHDAVYLLDGMPVIPFDAPGSASPQTATETIDMMVAPTDITGIEVYRGEVGIPAHLAAAAAPVGRRTESCGLIAIWTKR